MRRAVTRLLTLTALLALLPSGAAAQRDALETKDLRLVYVDPLQTYLTPHVARCFENSLRFHRDLWDYEPSETITVLLNDFSDGGNAAASSVPRNVMMFETSPLSLAYETVAPNERMNWLMNHELVHVMSMDQANKGDRFFRTIFAGKVAPIAPQPESILYFYLTAPRAAAPRWYQEGVAVFVETWMAGGRGRAQGAWDEMVFRSMVEDDSHFYDPLGLASEGTAVDFQVGVNNYLYGTRFVTWLAWRHSPEHVIQWVSRPDGSKRYYSSQFKKVFGQSLDEAWREWVEWEHGFQDENLAAIREYPITPHQDLSPRALGSVSRPHLDTRENRLYAALNYPGVVGHIASISLDDGGVEKIVDLKQPSIFTVTSLAWDPEGRTLFYTDDNYAYRDLMALDPDTGEKRLLIKDARTGELVFNQADRSLWGVRHFNGIASLVRIPEPWDEWERVRSWPYGEVLYNLDISPDGRLLSASVGDVTGRHALHVMEIEALLEEKAEPVAALSFDTALPLDFVFSPDGRYLFGSSYYTGVANVFRYEHAIDEWEAVSNTETGFFRPLPVADDELIVFRYTGEGFVPARIEPRPLEDVNPITFLGQQLTEKHPVVKSWKLPPPSSVSFEDMEKETKPYRITRGLRLESLYPIAQGYKDTGAVGLRVNFSDPLQLNRASFSASVSPWSGLPSEEHVHLNAEYRRYDWRGFAWLNNADFYDLFGPTRVGRKGHSVGVGWHRTLVWDEPRLFELDIEADYSGNLDRLPDYQNVPVDVDELWSLRAELAYSDTRSSLGHVDDEKGHRWSAVFQGQYVDGDSVPKLYGTYDLGFALPLKHSSVWVRSAAGVSVQQADQPFARFYFGGFGNNWVDRGEAKRYRAYYSFPGLELNEVGGRTFLKSMLEWNIPPLRFEEAGSPGFYLRWLRPALFGTVLVTDLDNSGMRRTLLNAGGQVDFSLKVLSRLEMTLSAGYAVAFEDGYRPRHEGMISLKVLQ